MKSKCEIDSLIKNKRTRKREKEIERKRERGRERERKRERERDKEGKRERKGERECERKRKVGVKMSSLFERKAQHFKVVWKIFYCDEENFLLADITNKFAQIKNVTVK